MVLHRLLHDVGEPAGSLDRVEARVDLHGRVARDRRATALCAARRRRRGGGAAPRSPSGPAAKPASSSTASSTARSSPAGSGCTLEVVGAVRDDPSARLAHVRRVEVRDDEHRLARRRGKAAQARMTNGFETGQSSSGVSKQPSEASVSGCESTACVVAGRVECGADVVEAHRPSLAESSFNSKGACVVREAIVGTAVGRALFTCGGRRGQVRLRLGAGAAEGR